MLERIETLVKKWHDLNEIDALSDLDLNYLGMTRQQLRRFTQMPNDLGNRVTHMATIFGISAHDLKQDYWAYVDLLDSCDECTHRSEHAHVLVLSSAAKPQDRRYFGNTHAFAEAAA